MEKINSFFEAQELLKEGNILTSNGSDSFVLVKGRVSVSNNGTRFYLSIDDFKDLYAKEKFYIYEDSVYIDDEKDYDYYRYYRK